MERTQNEYDILLRKELSKVTPDEAFIRELVKQGADITCEFLIDAVFCFTNPNKDESLDIRYFKLLVELGAEVNYAEDGFNCLYEACLSRRGELVELFIEAGANVNCIDTETKESLLDSVINEFNRVEQSDQEDASYLSLILNTLRRHGAMRQEEMNIMSTQFAKRTPVRIQPNECSFSQN